MPAELTNKNCHAIALYAVWSRKGDCWDNAVAEQFFRSLKSKCTSCKIYYVRNEVKQDIIDYIKMFYNTIQARNMINKQMA